MNTIIIDGAYTLSYVVIGESLDNVKQYVTSKKIFIITDSNVFNLYNKRFPECETYILEAGEENKNLTKAADIYRWLLFNNADRTSFILGIGGGVVCDVAGFIAATFMRGIEFGFVATTLLAQIDAAVGGKNGVNLDGYKNIVGTIVQPNFTICDTSLLKTLPQTELSNGFAEMVKHSLISSLADFEFLESNIESLNNCDLDILTEAVNRSVKVKSDIVNLDEQELQERKKLNLGHTWGHAVEKISGLPHGFAVSIGLEFAAKFSISHQLLSQLEYQRIISLLQKLKLPVTTNIDPKQIFEIIFSDKKKTGNQIDFILMNGIGNVVIKRVGFEEIKNFVLNPPNP